MDQVELGALEREDVVDNQGTRWRCFSTGFPLQESRVNMSVLEPFLRVLSHGGTASHLMVHLMVHLVVHLVLTCSNPDCTFSVISGYYGDGMNDIIVFSSCYLPENRLENYPYVMDNLFR